MAYRDPAYHFGTQSIRADKTYLGQPDARFPQSAQKFETVAFLAAPIAEWITEVSALDKTCIG